MIHGDRGSNAVQIFLLFLIFRPHLSDLGSHGCRGHGGWLGLVWLGFVTVMAGFMVGGGSCVAGFEVVGGGWFVLAFSSA